MHPEKPEFESQPDPVLNTVNVLYVKVSILYVEFTNCTVSTVHIGKIIIVMYFYAWGPVLWIRIRRIRMLTKEFNKLCKKAIQL